MELKQEKNQSYGNYVLLLIHFTLKASPWIYSLIKWIGSIDLFVISIIIIITFSFFSIIQVIIEIIKNQTKQRKPYELDIIIDFLSILIAWIILPFLPFNILPVMLVVLSLFGIVLTLGIYFIKFVSTIKKIKRGFIFFLISISIALIFALLTFDLVFSLIFIAIGIVSVITFNSKYNVWQKVNKEQKILVYIMIGALIVLITICIVTNIFFL